MSIEFKLPELGDGIDGGDVVSFLVAEGDEIAAEQDVLEMETDKAVVAVPCPHAGRVEKIWVLAGQRVTTGDLILTLAATNGAAAAAAKKPAPEAASGAPATAAATESSAPARPASKDDATEGAPARGGLPRSPPAAAAGSHPASSARPPAADDDSGDRVVPTPAAPATRRLARELGVDLRAVRGTGPGGRITREDVKVHVKVAMTGGASGRAGVAVDAPPLPDFSQWGEVDIRPLAGIRRATADAMSIAWRVVPHVTQFDEANITRLEAARKRYDEKRRADDAKVTVTALAVKAAAIALRKFPEFNASIDPAKGELIYKHYYHVGVAVDTEHGLLVPVLRDVDRKSVRAIAGELAELAARARQRKIDIAELRGGTFTITNLGGIGGTAFTPIVNYPEVAILGIARSRLEPVFVAGKLRQQLTMPLSLSYDHRIIDGADGARFLRFVAELLEEPFQFLLDL